MEAEIAVLPQVLPELENQGFQVGVGAAGVVWDRGPVGPIDAVEALAFGASHPAENGGRGDTELQSNLVE